MGITFFIIILLIVTYPWWSKWAFQLIGRWAEDRMRRTFGMPTRKEEERIRKAMENEQRRAQEQQRQARRRGTYRGSGNTGGKIIPEEYAEDVEFTEIKEFSQSEIKDPEGRKRYKFFHRRQETVEIEEQVEDAEYEEMK